MKKKPCPVCGRDYFGAGGPHADVCTPALRALVRAAVKYVKDPDPLTIHRDLVRATQRFRKERAR